jgi:UDP-glucose 4-epimerase
MFGTHHFRKKTKNKQSIVEVKAMKETILVTGGAGYIGSHTIKRLLETGYDVINLDNFTTGSLETKVTTIRGDIADKTLISRIVHEKNIKSVIHFAAKSLVGESMMHPHHYFGNNTAKSLLFFEACIDSGVKHIIFSSTAAVYGIPEMVPISEKAKIAPINPYGKSKALIEESLASIAGAVDIKWAALRYFNAAGASLEGEMGEDHDPETHLIPSILKAVKSQSSFTVYGNDYDTKDGSCVRDYVHVIDLANAHIAALRGLQEGKPNGAYNIGSGVGFSNFEIVREIERITGEKVELLLGDRRGGDPAILIADPSKLQETFGWKPHYSDLETIIATAWAWEQGK